MQIQACLTLFRNPDFIVLHKDTRAAINNYNCILTRRKLYKKVMVNPSRMTERKRKKKKDVNPFCLLYCDDVHHHRIVDLDLPFLDGGEANLKHVQVLACCDGIAWLQLSYNGRYNSWHTDTTELLMYTVRFGLSFDPRRNHVNAVRLCASQRYTPGDYSGTFVYKAEVWDSSSTTSDWRQIDAAPPFPPHRAYGDRDGVCVGGKCYWDSTVRGYIRPIASFDMVHETFEIIPPPDYASASIHELNLRWKMTEMRRSLAIMAMDEACCPTTTNLIVHVWVLMMNGTRCDVGQGGGASSSCSWSKYLTVELWSIPGLPAFPLGFCRDTILLKHDYHGDISFFSLHDIFTGETTPGDIELLCDHFAFLTEPAYACHESLISFKAGN